jgi:acyl dehydratase
MSETAVGTELPTIEQTANLVTSVMYAGASGDMNPLHYDESFAANVSPTGGTIAHGMYSMGLASRLLTEWAGGADKVVSVEVRFTKPWPLNSTTTFAGTVTDVTDGVATVELRATNANGDTVLRGTGKARV